jgi:methionyl-tRNA formyltransferase
MHELPRPVKPLNVMLAGEESAGAQTLKRLAVCGHRVVGVLASPDRVSRSGASVWQLAQQLGYRTWTARTVKDPAFADVMRAEQVDVLLNVHALYIVAPAVVEAPRLGSFNLHPGPLPEYAGLNTVSWALSRGATEHGVTLHRMDPGIDTGPVVYQTRFAVTADDTALAVYSKCIRHGLELVEQLLTTDPAAWPSTPQDLTRREYFGKQIPADGCVQWDRPAREIYNLVRACDYFPFASPWGSPRAVLNGLPVGLVKTRLTGVACHALPGTVRAANQDAVEVACADEWLRCERVLWQERAVNAATVMTQTV